ncbi:MAG: hypothetical protein ACPG05_00845 [Bdellovibrionales bacterium]
MSNIIDNITGGYKASAKVTAGTLVLSLPDAVTPVVWRMDMGTAKSSAIEVRENEDGHYDLMLKTPKADAHKIATYEFKIKATQALMAVTKAMKKAESYTEEAYDEDGKKRHLPVPVYAPKPQSKTFKVFKYIYIILSLAAFSFIGFGLYQIMVSSKNPSIPALSQRSVPNNFLHDETLEQPSPTNESSSVKKKTGEVISADDFLKRK